MLHQFQSPLINDRTDAWGGDESGRNRLTLAVVDAVRNAIPDSMPLLLRISASDWAEGGIDAAASVRLAGAAAEHGVDLVDVSSGGAVAHQQIPAGPGYQTGFASRIRREAGVRTGTVGLLTSPGRRNTPSPPARLTGSSLRARHCATRTGGCGPPSSSATSSRGPRSMNGPFPRHSF